MLDISFRTIATQLTWKNATKQKWKNNTLISSLHVHGLTKRLVTMCPKGRPPNAVICRRSICTKLFNICHCHVLHMTALYLQITLVVLQLLIQPMSTENSSKGSMIEPNFFYSQTTKLLMSCKELLKGMENVSVLATDILSTDSLDAREMLSNLFFAILAGASPSPC